MNSANVQLTVGQVLTGAQLYPNLIQTGDDFLARVKYHIVGNNYHLSEEINLNTGYEQGANDLTWSYGTVISAMNARLAL